MSFEAAAVALVADVDTFANFEPPVVKPPFPANDPADPEAGWAARNPAQALLFLFVSPRDCGALDELMAL